VYDQESFSQVLLPELAASGIGVGRSRARLSVTPSRSADMKHLLVESAFGEPPGQVPGTPTDDHSFAMMGVACRALFDLLEIRSG
jgi:hypothetical protein